MNAIEHIQLKVCSAHAEVIPVAISLPYHRPSLLRTRGGDPRSSQPYERHHPSAPHTRR